MDNSQAGIVIIDREGRVESLNRLAINLLGSNLSQAVGQPVNEIFVAYEADSDERIDLASERYRNPQFESTRAYLKHSESNRRPISFQLRPNHNPQHPEHSGALLYVRDLSQTENTEAQIRLIATALKSIGEGVLITDTNWQNGEARILFSNDGFSEITGYSEIEVIGKPISILNGPSTDLSIMEDMIEDLAAGRAAAGEMVGSRKDGSEFIMALKVFPVPGADGSISHHVAIQRDVSQIRRLEQDLFQSQKMEAVGRLAGGIAHDFNNILAVILSFSDLILDKADDDDPNRKFLTEIRKAAERATDLTQQLLSFSRRNKNLKPEVLDVIKVASDMQKILRRLIPENIQFNIRFQETPIYVNINRTAIEQILINFTTNARDAMPNGGEVTLSIVELSPEKAAQHLPEYIEARPYMALTFEDNGMGIDPETQRHIFEPFFTTKELGKGTGLGLATVYGIVKQSNGHIDLASEQGKGTRFTVYLPQVASKKIKETVKEEPPPESFPPANRETILVVEDDETMCDCISGLLVYHNYEVFSTNQAEDALDFLEDSDADIRLLITDLILPKMRGSELAERLLKRYPNMEVIYMTGYSEELLGQFNVPESSTVMKKPFSLKSVLGNVQRALAAQNK